MIKFEKYYDGIQTHIQAISTKETKNNGNIDCCYTIGKYIKEEIEDLQNQLQQKENIIKEVRDKKEELMYLASKCSIIYRNNIEVVAIYDRLKELFEILEKGDEK